MGKILNSKYVKFCCACDSVNCEVFLFLSISTVALKGTCYWLNQIFLFGNSRNHAFISIQFHSTWESLGPLATLQNQWYWNILLLYFKHLKSTLTDETVEKGFTHTRTLELWKIKYTTICYKFFSHAVTNQWRLLFMAWLAVLKSRTLREVTAASLSQSMERVCLLSMGFGWSSLSDCDYRARPEWFLLLH